MKNYLITPIRNFLTSKTTNMLSIGGLSLGIAISLLMGWWALNEMNFDNFNADKDKIFRVAREGFLNNETVRIGSVFGPVSNEAKERFPQIEESVRIVPRGKQRIQVGEKVNYEESIYLADKNFFQFFSYPIKIGHHETFFDALDNIVITEEFATKYFGNQNPIGEIVEVDNKAWQVSAVMYDTPVNSHIRFNAICALEGLPNVANRTWGNGDQFGTYFKVAKNTDTNELAKNITAMAREKFPPYGQIDIHHFLQPLQNIHFDTENFRFDYAVKSDKRFVLIFLVMAVAILVIACINFTNLFISTSFLRAKSIGIKKTNGASKLSLIKEFIVETFLYVVISVLLGIIWSAMALPLFNQLANSNIYFDFSNISFYILLLCITIASTIMAGTFPALYITNFNPITTLKGKFSGANVSGIQKSLVILQFAASIVLLITVVSIKKQVNYLQNIDLGFNKSNTVYVDAIGEFGTSYKTVKSDLESNPSIIEVTAKNCIPSDWNNGMPIATAETRDNPYIMEICQISDNYLDMMDIEITRGENISMYHDSLNYVLINEQAVSVLGLDNPIDQVVYMDDEQLIIKGVIEDIKTKSLHSTVDPQVYTNLSRIRSSHVLMIRISDDTQAAIKAIKEKWLKVNPEYPFEFHFLEDTYDELYQIEKRAEKIVTCGMGFALFITMIGLFAMARYTTERRTKEIGVRIVNGAKVYEILKMLNMDFIKWVIIAFVIACPIAWYSMEKWLTNFAHRTSLSWWIFAIAGILALGIALTTVSWQSWKAATRNPVEALRYE